MYPNFEKHPTKKMDYPGKRPQTVWEAKGYRTLSVMIVVRFMMI